MYKVLKSLKKGNGLHENFSSSLKGAASRATAAVVEAGAGTISLMSASYNAMNKQQYESDLDMAGGMFFSAAEDACWAAAYTGAAVLHASAFAAKTAGKALSNSPWAFGKITENTCYVFNGLRKGASKLGKGADSFTRTMKGSMPIR